ncbi:MAG: CPBP family intramembrane metalloprotease [Mogibacterium sp.]|nr:CPBP family intramembrane metalloprotease [Mogibacterium sp.]
MKKRSHRILDHPVLGYFLLTLLGMIFSSLGDPIDTRISNIVPGYAMETASAGGTYTTASGLGTAVASLAVLGLFWLWFRPDYKGCLKVRGLKTGLLMLLPFLIIHYCGSIVSWFTFGIGGVLAAFLRSFAPGFGEEVAFRGMGVANYMRTIRSENQIKVIFWLSSIVFGATHLANILAGGDVFSCVVQAIYAAGVGMLFCAVYLRTGSLWPTIIGHTSVDFMELIRADLSASGGIMTGMGIGDWITIAAGAFAAFWALRLIRPEYYPQIMDIWADKWNRKQELRTAGETSAAMTGSASTAE